MAQPILSPVLPEEKYFILTVLILGSASMLVNTVLRNMFMDPIAQAHLQHRQREVRQIMNEARMNRDSSLQDKAMTLQQQMMPEQMDLQTGMMKPMMFTMVFIIGIFAWLTTSVENFRVDYVSLPLTPEWNLLDDRFLFFPAWICAYICMSAPLGRVVDRHMKLIRYKSHPLVLDGGRISEPLLHLVQTKSLRRKRRIELTITEGTRLKPVRILLNKLRKKTLKHEAIQQWYVLSVEVRASREMDHH